MTSTTTPPSLLNSTPIVPQPNAPIFELPHEVITRILALLPASQVATTSLVCREWYRKFEFDDTFRSIFRYQFPSIDESTVSNFKNFYHFYSNLTNEVYASRIFHGHRDTVLSLAVIGETLFSGSDDKTIKAWDIKTGKCIATFEGHESPVNSLAVVGETLFSGSSDATIKAWNIKTGACIATFEGHEDEINSLAVVGETLFSGSDDKTIKAWDIKTGACIATFHGHKDTVYSLAVVGEMLFSGSDDKTIKAWDIKTGACIATFHGHKDTAYSLAVVGETLFSGSSDATIKAWNIKTGACIATFQGHKDWVLSLALVGETLFSGSRDDTIKAWDIKTGKCIATFHGHKDTVLSLALVGQTLFAGSADKMIKAWNFTADRSEIFKEIAELLETEKPKAIQEALERFSKMPIRARTAICTMLHGNLDTEAFCTTEEINERSLRPEDIFYDKCLLRKATSAQKAQAIRDYLSLPTLHLTGSSGFSANGKRTHDTAFGTKELTGD
jgi:WD40 repeat protein